MAMFHYKKVKGLTLIEVLIALAILAISLTAVLRVASSNIKNTLALKSKTIAHWVSLDVVHRLQMGLYPVPSGQQTTSGETDMLSRTWRWQATITQTQNPNISKLNVSVYDKYRAHLPLASIESFLCLNPRTQKCEGK